MLLTWRSLRTVGSSSSDAGGVLARTADRLDAQRHGENSCNSSSFGGAVLTDNGVCGSEKRAMPSRELLSGRNPADSSPFCGAFLPVCVWRTRKRLSQKLLSARNGWDLPVWADLRCIVGAWRTRPSAHRGPGRPCSHPHQTRLERRHRRAPQLHRAPGAQPTQNPRVHTALPLPYRGRSLRRR